MQPEPPAAFLIHVSVSLTIEKPKPSKPAFLRRLIY